MVRAQNKKKKKSGGFQSMGLSYPVFKAIMKKGYKVPTPIQRKTIPVILDGKDVVAMARTGSGKTACFLLPMFERLKTHSAQTGARALILSPTRELALQTLKFTKELGKFTGLKTALILGGDRMEDQFAALHENPDIIIATPGRLVHVAVEMNLKLQSVEYVVFDEADRLFEMGFAEQLQEIIARLPGGHQTVLFSATLPKLLVEFARAGLTEPVLIRLDVDTKLNEQLKTSFFLVREDTKAAVLLHLLRNVVRPQDQTVVFVATKHHAEYLTELLTTQRVSCAHIYSALDPTARKINLAKFTLGKCSALIVTDLAARGLDIPLLDNVINYSFLPRASSSCTVWAVWLGLAEVAQPTPWWPLTKSPTCWICTCSWAAPLPLPNPSRTPQVQPVWMACWVGCHRVWWTRRTVACRAPWRHRWSYGAWPT